MKLKAERGNNAKTRPFDLIKKVLSEENISPLILNSVTEEVISRLAEAGWSIVPRHDARPNTVVSRAYLKQIEDKIAGRLITSDPELDARVAEAVKEYKKATVALVERWKEEDKSQSGDYDSREFWKKRAHESVSERHEFLDAISQLARNRASYITKDLGKKYGQASRMIHAQRIELGYLRYKNNVGLELSVEKKQQEIEALKNRIDNLNWCWTERFKTLKARHGIK
jgi:hypothetical protein